MAHRHNRHGRGRFTVDPSDTYSFQIAAVDAAGNEALSDTWVTRP